MIGVRRFGTSWWKLDTQTLNITLPRFPEKSGNDYVVMMMMMMIMMLIMMMMMMMMIIIIIIIITN